MILHSSRLESRDAFDAVSTELLQTSLDGVVWIAQGFNQKIHQVDTHAVSPFPPYSIYLAARQQNRIWQETGDLRCLDATNSLALMLSHLGRRWLNASESSGSLVDTGKDD